MSRAAINNTPKEPLGNRYTVVIAALGLIVAIIGIAVEAFKVEDMQAITYDYSDRSISRIDGVPDERRPAPWRESPTPMPVPTPTPRIPPPSTTTDDAANTPRDTRKSPPAVTVPRSLPPAYTPPVARPRPTPIPAPEPRPTYETDRVLADFYNEFDELRIRGARAARDARDLDRCVQVHDEWQNAGLNVLRRLNAYLDQRYGRELFFDQKFGAHDMSVVWRLPESQGLSHCKEVLYTRAETLGKFDALVKYEFVMNQ